MSDVLTYFGDLMQHTFQVYSFVGEDEYGNPEFDAPTGPWRGRVDILHHRRGASGSASTVDKPDKEEPDATIISEPVSVHVRDQVEVLTPTDAANIMFTVSEIQQEFDELTLHHLEISLRWERP